VLRQGTKSWPARSVVGNLSFGASEESFRALFETHGTVSLRPVPAQAPCLQRVRSAEVALWEGDLPPGRLTAYLERGGAPVAATDITR
jgi:hypothetical protein